MFKATKVRKINLLIDLQVQINFLPAELQTIIYAVSPVIANSLGTKNVLRKIFGR